jgi:methionyl-tRNA formyltransferase
MDAGPILLQRACPIRPEDDAGSLHDRLAVLGAAALADAIRILAAGEARWMPQEPSEVSLAPKLGDADCRVELAGNPAALVNRIRGLSPAPGAYLILADGQRLRLLKAEAREGSGPPGAILAIDEASVVVGTGEGAMALREVQPAGKRRMSAAEFARGRRLRVGAPYA